MGICAKPIAQYTCTEISGEVACRSVTLITRATSSPQATGFCQPAGSNTREHDPEYTGRGKPWRGGAHLEAPHHCPTTSQHAQVGVLGLPSLVGGVQVRRGIQMPLKASPSFLLVTFSFAGQTPSCRCHKGKCSALGYSILTVCWRQHPVLLT